MGLLLKENGCIDTDHLDLTLGGGKTQLDILTGLENIADTVLALVDGSHVDSFFIDDAKDADKDKTVSHNVPQVIGLGVDREALTNILVIVENIVEKSCNSVSLFEGVCVLGALNIAGSCGSFTTGGLSTEASLLFLDLEDHLEVLVPVDDAIAVGIVLTEKICDLLFGDISSAHVFEQCFEFNLLNLAISRLVEVLKGSDYSELFFRAHELSVGVRDLVNCFVCLSVNHCVL